MARVNLNTSLGGWGFYTQAVASVSFFPPLTDAFKKVFENPNGIDIPDGDFDPARQDSARVREKAQMLADGAGAGIMVADPFVTLMPPQMQPPAQPHHNGSGEPGMGDLFSAAVAAVEAARQGVLSARDAALLCMAVGAVMNDSDRRHSH